MFVNNSRTIYDSSYSELKLFRFVVVNEQNVLYERSFSLSVICYRVSFNRATYLTICNHLYYFYVSTLPSWFPRTPFPTVRIYLTGSTRGNCSPQTTFLNCYNPPLGPSMDPFLVTTVSLVSHVSVVLFSQGPHDPLSVPLIAPTLSHS